MTELERLSLLQTRLHDFEVMMPRPSERSVIEVACAALREEIGQLGRRLMRDRYWRPVPALVRAG